MNLASWLKSKGFASFTCFGSNTETYENRPVSDGGIRIWICGDVASIWCVNCKVNILAIETQQIPDIVSSILLA